MDYYSAINRLIHWADDKGYHVMIEPDGDDTICYQSKTISIKSTRRDQIQLYILLHECGHLLTENNGSVHKFDLIKESYTEKAQIVKTYNVIEEVEAWKRGRVLANRLGIPVDEKVWQKEVSKAITKYMKWALGLPF